MTEFSPSAQTGGQSGPRIGWFTAACVLVSNIIGGAIFTSTGFMARDLGDPTLILSLWAVGAFLALAGAMSYSELGAALPHAGGDYVYLRYSYGPLISFLSGWASLTVGFGAGIAASAVSFSAYALRVAHISEEPSFLAKGLALILVWSLTAAHAAGTEIGGFLQRLLTTTKVVAILTLILGGLLLGSGSWANLVIPAPEIQPRSGRLIVALIFVLYTYLGWNVVGYIAGEIEEPQRNIPWIVIGGTGFVAVVYILLNLVYLYALPVAALAKEPVLPVAEKAASALWGPITARLVAMLLCISIAGGMSSMIWAGPRVYWTMAADGVFPSFFKNVSPSTGVPVRAILLQSAWASLLILTGTFEQLVIFSGFILATFNALSISAVIILRWLHPELARPYRVPFYPILPGLVIAALLIVVGYSLIERPLESVLGIAIILTGIPLYFLWRTPPGNARRCGSRRRFS